MAKMPRGQSRSTVDPTDQELIKRRTERQAQQYELKSPQELLDDFQNGPKIPRPNMAQSFIPVVGPLWEAAGDLQDGDYAGAAFNTGMAVVDVLPVGVIAKGGRMAVKGVGALKTTGSVSHDAVRSYMKRRDVIKPGHQLHHSIPLNGKSRNAQDWRNHPMFLKQLPEAQHQRVHRKWGGEERFDPLRQVWYGTTDWQKVAPTVVVGEVADAIENVRSRRPGR